ncbi:hypothetical protein [Deinococcus sp. QL22]|uniref:hypothetical protein n=1 Tax=Deinococcus sp. QL22 TaxID=2939437 RepID=UPI0020178742|nr:hypothetical protein [Deinococcus sp. QL22]UQN10038.1 hypothetical protein M1R55_26915 [Deinococcus sp. QL22]
MTNCTLATGLEDLELLQQLRVALIPRLTPSEVLSNTYRNLRLPNLGTPAGSGAF